MKYWFDTEFIEYPATIDLISIGIVAEDGREFYAESCEVDWSKADEWYDHNVKPYLLSNGISKREIKGQILHFIGGDVPEFWAYYADFDWVGFCWLFGRLIDKPEGWPKYCMDIKQWAVELGSPKLPKQEEHEHHALADARWNRQAWEYLDQLAKSR